jgi:Domain of unknown function (DUF4190)
MERGTATILPGVRAEQPRRVRSDCKAATRHLARTALVASGTSMSETEGGWQSSWQRPQEGEWKQAPDGTWYKDTGSAPKPAAPTAPAPQPAAPAWGQSHPGQFVPASGVASGKAVAALILGVGGLTFCPFVCSVFALVLGYQARAEIDRAGGARTGRGQATAGIVLGWIAVAIFVLLIALVAVGVMVGGSDSGVTTELTPS